MPDPDSPVGFHQPPANINQSNLNHPHDQLAMWVDEHADALYRFALLRVRDQHTVEDLLQETYLAALGSSPDFRGESTTRTWLVAILRLKIIDYYRRTNKEQSHQATTGPADTKLERQERLKHWNCDPGESLEKHEFWEVLRNCVDKLPATLARAFALREFDDCTPTQACELLRITQENLAVRLFRARTLLRDCLDKHWFSED